MPPDEDEACEGQGSGVSSRSSSQDGSDGNGDPGGALSRGLTDPSRMKQIDSEFDATDKGKAASGAYLLNMRNCVCRAACGSEIGLRLSRDGMACMPQ